MKDIIVQRIHVYEENTIGKDVRPSLEISINKIHFNADSIDLALSRTLRVIRSFTNESLKCISMFLR